MRTENVEIFRGQRELTPWKEDGSRYWGVVFDDWTIYGREATIFKFWTESHYDLSKPISTTTHSVHFVHIHTILIMVSFLLCSPQSSFPFPQPPPKTVQTTVRNTISRKVVHSENQKSRSKSLVHRPQDQINPFPYGYATSPWSSP